MKRQYITPSTLCVKLGTRRLFLTGSLQTSDEEIDPGTDNANAGWAREDDTDNTNNRGSVWDNVW